MCMCFVLILSANVMSYNMTSNIIYMCNEVHEKDYELKRIKKIDNFRSRTQVYGLCINREKDTAVLYESSRHMRLF